MVLPGTDHPVIAHANAIRAAMLKRDAALLNGLVREYARSYRILKADLRRLLDVVKGTKPTRGQVLQLAATRNLLDGVKAELDRFAVILAGKIEKATQLEMELANIDTLAMVQASLPGMEPARIIGTWTQVAPEQVYQIYGFTDPNGPLYASIRAKFSKAVADLVREGLIEGLITGMNPREIARLLAKAQGIGLDWALNAARTANLWAYRAAAHQNYLNNSHVVRGWIWFAQLDDRVCLSCISQHGSQHSLNEILADHHQGRCTPLPVTATYAELGIDGVDDVPLVVQRGEDWFKALIEDRQRKIMGPSMYRAWQDHAFTFDQLSKPYNDPIYGRMLREASLKDLLGDKAKLYYGQ